MQLKWLMFAVAWCALLGLGIWGYNHLWKPVQEQTVENTPHHQNINLEGFVDDDPSSSAASRMAAVIVFAACEVLLLGALWVWGCKSCKVN